MMIRTNFILIGMLAVISLVAAFVFLPVNAQQTGQAPDTASTRFNVSTEVLPGALSMTLFYITDSKTNKLHIYRVTGGLDTSFKSDPELYRTFDLTTVGQKNLGQAK